MKRHPVSKRTKIGMLIAVGILTVAGFSWKPLLIHYRISKAKSALESRNGEKALEWLLANQHLASDHAENQFLLARAYRRLGRLNEVRSHLERARELGYSKQMIKREQWLAYAQSGQLKEAEPHLSELLRDPKGDGREICEAYVAGYLLHHRTREAFEILDAWQKDYPHDGYPYSIRGMIWGSTGNRKQAIESYRKSLQVDSKQVAARFQLAALLMEQQLHDEAGELYMQCLKDDPDNVEVLTGWSQWLLVKGRREDARDALNRAIKARPAFREARLAMGRLELSSDRPKDALRWLEPLAKEFPYDRLIRYALARALQRAGQTEAATAHFDYAQKAEAASTQIQLLVEQLQEDIQNVDVRFKIGTTMMQYGNPIKATIWLRSVLEIDQRHQQAHAALADHYEKHGPADLAKRHRLAINKQ